MSHRSPRRTGRVGASVFAALALTLSGAGGVAAMAAPAPAPSGGTVLGDAESLGVVPAPADVKVVPGAYLVELTAPAAAQGGSERGVAKARDAALTEAGGDDIAVEATYSSLWSGVSVRTDEEGAARLAGASNVRAVYPVIAVETPQPVTGDSTDPQLATAISMTGADVVQDDLGLTGAGVKVGVIDSGIDIDHPDLGGVGVDDQTLFPTERVTSGWDFVGDDYNADPSSDAYQPTPRPDAVPDDCGGHGTHVAGIVGANGEITGVAPDVTFGAYRVFGCDGSTSSDIIISALERAQADGMDVINMSIGAAFQTWPTYPTAVAADRLVDAGVVVVASIGNSGANGIFSAGAPGVGSKTIGVASVDNVEITSRSFLVNDTPVPFRAATGAPTPPTSGTAIAQTAGAPGTPEGQGCVAPANDVAGKIAVVQRGTCSFHIKAVTAQEAGAIGVVIYDNQPGTVNPTVEGPTPITIPVVMVSQIEGEAVAAAAAEGADFEWTDGWTQSENPTGGAISDFSSWGLAADLSMKPDLAAPGGSIHSTYPLELGGEETMGGTSMASPHVAGAAALMLEADSSLTPAQVRERLQATASQLEFSLIPAGGFTEAVHRQGAGMIDVARAISSPVTVSPSRILLGETQRNPVVTTIKLTNTSDEPRTYEIGSIDAVSTNGSPNRPTFLLGEAGVTSPESVTVPANGTARVKIAISAPDLDQAIYGGYITLLSDSGDLSIPFTGFAGDYQALPVLTDAGQGMPALARFTECGLWIEGSCEDPDGRLALVDPMHRFSMAEGDQPQVLLHFENPAQRLTMRVFRANAEGKVVGQIHPVFNTILEQDGIGRSGTATGISAFGWDGTRLHANGNADNKVVPDGTYVIQVQVLKALGNPRNANHIETWTSPAFQIDRDGDGNPVPCKPGKGKGKGNACS